MRKGRKILIAGLVIRVDADYFIFQDKPGNKYKIRFNPEYGDEKFQKYMNQNRLLTCSVFIKPTGEKHFVSFSPGVIGVCLQKNKTARAKAIRERDELRQKDAPVYGRNRKSSKLNFNGTVFLRRGSKSEKLVKQILEGEDFNPEEWLKDT